MPLPRFPTTSWLLARKSSSRHGSFSSASRRALWGWGLVAAIAALGACHPLDQRTFDPMAGKAPYVPHPAPKAVRPGAPALLEVMVPTPESTWKPVLHQAVQAALSSKRNILFQVTGTAPLAPTPDEQTKRLEALNHDAVEPIAAELVASGARDVQVQMKVISVPGLLQPAVRVTVR
ncbi:hypothetical protein E3E12_05325 [Formicincola oecophyllae]|uniref:Uncharacterized protein n=1 Tax=Formicincola oecophyllae TaxID=2558361 RepID=A0A4Y6UC58_9PROT|nr:hypothetical protein [Formicincola oecophyllae]QDH13705.1 hypothetical protein E3E12_05325 [Formicincola oecophyllae]